MKKPSSNFEKSKDPATSDDDESSEDETSSEEESSEEEDSSEEDSEYEYDDRGPSDVANETLWPSWNARNTWLATVRSPNISCGLLATAVSALSDYSHDFGIYEAEKSSQTTRSGRIVKSTRGQSRFHTRDHPWF